MKWNFREQKVLNILLRYALRSSDLKDKGIYSDDVKSSSHNRTDSKKPRGTLPEATFPLTRYDLF